MMKKSAFALIAVAGLATGASGQTAATYQLRATNAMGGMITPTSPSVTIEVWATWTGALHLFAGGDYDLNASEAGWVAGAEVNVLNGPASTVGTLLGSSYTGASNGQLHIPALGFFGDPANPILLATYEWTTTDFTNRTVFLNTSNTGNFLVAWINDGPGGVPPAGTTVQLFPANFSPGSGFIVFPAPSALALLGLGGLVMSRRRR